MPKLIYAMISITMNAVIIGKTMRNPRELRSDYTRQYGNNMCIHYFDVNNFDLDSLERLIHNELRDYKRTNELYDGSFYNLYLDRISQIIRNFGNKDIYPVHADNVGENMQWYPT